MNLQLIVLSFALLVVSLTCVAATPWIDIENKNKSCCSLEWENLIVGSKEIQRAISVQTDYGPVFLRKDSVIQFVMKSGFPAAGTEVTLLSNPYNCSIVWLDAESSSSSLGPHEFDYYFPSINGIYTISRTRQEQFRYHTSNRYANIAEYFTMFKPPIKSHDLCAQRDSSYHCNDLSRSIMAIDCVASIKNILHPRLESIDIDESLLRENAVQMKYTPVVMINPSNFTRNETYESEIKLPVGVKFNLEGTNYPLVDYLENRTHIDLYFNRANDSQLANSLRTIDFSPTLMAMHRRSVDRPFALSYSMHEVKREITISPQTRCKVTSSVLKYKVTLPVTVKLSIAPRQSVEEYWTRDKILSSFEARKIDTSFLSREGDLLTFQYNGTISVRGFISEEPDSQCESLASK